MKHPVATLEGALLDAAVALAEGWKPDGQGWAAPIQILIDPYSGRTEPGVAWELRPYPWSREWMYGGPIIQRERIVLLPRRRGGAACIPLRWSASREQIPTVIWASEINGPETAEYVLGPTEVVIEAPRVWLGPTPLVAAMRAFVASKLGEEVDL